MKIKPKKITNKQQKELENIVITKGYDRIQMLKVYHELGFHRNSIYDLSFSQAKQLIERIS